MSAMPSLREDGQRVRAATVSPVIIARLGGMSAAISAHLGDGDADHHAEAIDRVENHLSRRRTAVSDALYEAVPQVDDKRLRGRLIALRRDIFNGRVSSATDVNGLVECLPAPTARLLAEYISVLTECECQQALGHVAYVAELGRTRTTLRQLLQDEEFRKGLQLASPALMSNLARYCGIATGDALSSREDRKSVV